MARSLTFHVRSSCLQEYYTTHKVLLLSGMGLKGEVARNGIPQKVESPYIGQILFEYMNVKHSWRLRHPEIGAAGGSEGWDNPE